MEWKNVEDEEANAKRNGERNKCKVNEPNRMLNSNTGAFTIITSRRWNKPLARCFSSALTIFLCVNFMNETSIQTADVDSRLVNCLVNLSSEVRLSEWNNFPKQV